MKNAIVCIIIIIVVIIKYLHNRCKFPQFRRNRRQEKCCSASVKIKFEIKTYIELLLFLIINGFFSTDCSKIGVTYVLAKPACLWLNYINSWL